MSVDVWWNNILGGMLKVKLTFVFVKLVEDHYLEDVTTYYLTIFSSIVHELGCVMKQYT